MTKVVPSANDGAEQAVPKTLDPATVNWSDRPIPADGGVTASARTERPGIRRHAQRRVPPGDILGHIRVGGSGACWQQALDTSDLSAMPSHLAAG